MRPITLLSSLALCLTLALLAWLAAWTLLISQEDYTPEPGSITYYLGISPLVRHAPLARAADRPQYHGTVGDGSKQPKSLVSYGVEHRDIDAALQAMDGYLRGRGWQRRPTAPSDMTTAFAAQDAQIVHHAQYESAAQEVAVLEVARATTATRHILTLTHYD